MRLPICRVHSVASEVRSDGQPRSHSAHSAAAATGHSIFTTAFPRRASIRISGRLGSVGVIATDKNSEARATGSLDSTRRRRLGTVTPRTPIHLRSRFALTPLASAIPATDTPGSLHARTSSSLNSSLCLRLRRGAFSIPIVSTIILSGHHGAQLNRLGIDVFTGRLQVIHNNLLSHFRSSLTPAALQPHVWAAFAEYESAKTNAGILTSERIFNEINITLSSEWEQIKQSANIR